MKSRAVTVLTRTGVVASSLVVGGRRDRSTLRLGDSVGAPIGDIQEHGDHHEWGDHKTHFVPTALMCEDHADDRTVWGTSRERRPFYSTSG